MFSENPACFSSFKIGVIQSKVSYLIGVQHFFFHFFTVSSCNCKNRWISDLFQFQALWANSMFVPSYQTSFNLTNKHWNRLLQTFFFSCLISLTLAFTLLFPKTNGPCKCSALLSVIRRTNRHSCSTVVCVKRSESSKTAYPVPSSGIAAFSHFSLWC